jgi:UDP-GlcNAc:undecaprenyl-phosphate GlcNAc-1-phosphate transferase
MVDGIDGLIGSLSLNTFTAIAVLFLMSGNSVYLSYPLILATATLPYLIFNLGYFNKYSKKIFMGDAGSMFIGLSVIWLLTIGTQGEGASFRPVTALWIIAVPLMDMFAIMIRRIKKGVSPFQADNGHLHHICMRLGLSSRKSLWAISALAVLFAVIGIIGEKMNIPEWTMLLLFLIAFSGYSYALQHAWKFIKAIK